MGDNNEKTKHGIEKYLKIMELFNKKGVDVSSQETDFQKLFNGFYQVRRNVEWRTVFYGYMQEHRADYQGCVSTGPIKEIMESLAEKEPKNRVELSFASKLLHTIIPTYPIYDKNVAAHLNERYKLGITPPNPKLKKDEKIAHQVRNYQKLIDWYQSGEASQYEAIFDKLFDFQKYNIGRVKKIDFIIWRGLYTKLNDIKENKTKNDQSIFKRNH